MTGNHKTNVPADLRSAGIKYKDLLIRLKYRLFKFLLGNFWGVKVVIAH